MRERRSLALLDLAIGASAAVGPLLFVIMLVVASARSSDEVRDGRDNERYLSVRRLAALKTFERAIVPRDRVAAAPPHAAALLEGLPACARDWDGRSGPLLMFRRLFTRAPVNEVTPAERIALDLASIDQELLRFSSAQNRRVAGTLGFDGARWFEAAAAALATPVDSPGYPDRRFHVQCADLASAVSALARSNARMLAALAWRGTVVDRVAARWQSDQWVEFSARQIARSNPWAGLPGCVYFVSGDGAPSHYVAGSEQPWCMRDEVSGSGADGAQPVRVPGEPVRGMAPDDPRWSVPPSLATMLRPLDSLRRPSGALYREIASAPDDATPSLRSARHGPNRIEVAGHEVELGFSVDVTIDPRLQALAQRTAACYTGRDDVCRALDMRRREDDGRAIGHRMVEQAMVRLAAIAIVDVESGRIEALAGALSPCSEQEQDGPGRSSQCDGRIPYPIRYRPDALLNAAVFHDAMPASTIKPVMAAALLADPAVGARWLAAERAEMARSPKAVPSAQSLRGQLMRSDSARFLDRAFCADTDFSGCARTWAIASHAQRLGWNSGCANAPRDACGRRDLLFGHAAGSPDGDGLAQPPALEVAYGRLMAEPVGGRLGAPFRARSPIALDVAKVRRCAAGPDGRRGTRDDWEKCGGGVVVDIVAEGWGQGHARASPLGGAGMMAALAASANGQPARALHLVRAVRGTGPGSAITTAPASERANAPRPIERDVAEVILSGLSFGHRAGTSRLACEQVFDARTCSTMEWIAGKTGTPTFPNDERTLDDVHALCTSAAQLSARERLACGPLRPYKWYVAAYRTGAGDARWTKAVAVLVERNWVASTGRIDSAGDHGSNPAAEIALQIAGRHAGHLAWSSP